MGTCVSCRQPFPGRDPGCCSVSCRADADLEMRALAQQQRRLADQLVPGRGWRHWLPAERRRRAAVRREVDDIGDRAALLLAAKLGPRDDPEASVPGGDAPASGAEQGPGSPSASPPDADDPTARFPEPPPADPGRPT